MSKQPTTPAPVVALHSIRFREETVLSSLNSVRTVIPGYERTKHCQIAVSGASVFVALPASEPPMFGDDAAKAALGEARAVVEVPRSACTIRWLVSADLPMASIVEAIQARKTSVCPDAAVAAKRGAEEL